MLSSPQVVDFEDFSLDLRQCVLQRRGEVIELRPKAFDVLRHLVANAGSVVSKQQLFEALWPGLVVTDDALVQCVSDIRQALSDSGQRIIRTLPRRGYLFAIEATPRLSGPVAQPASAVQSIDECRAADGVRLAFAAVGRGLPLVRTPTWFNHLEHEWQVPFRGGLYQFLTERLQLIRYDGRGSGLSERYVPEITFDTFGRDLQAVVDAMELPRFALLGISQGAPVAIAYAARHPERVSKLIINGGFALGRNKRGSAKDLETGQAYLTLMRHGWGDEHSAFLRSFGMLYFPGLSSAQIRALAELQRMAMSGDAAIRTRMACDDIDVADLLERVSAPTLVLHSRYDNAVPFDEGQRLAAAMPNARFVVLESENHVPVPGEPAWPIFLAEIDAFLRE
jgi:DNA-binding winged helix-turn-helix (wHTH) protein/alpha-beta hydrolase superfamily lysophospholipase